MKITLLTGKTFDIKEALGIDIKVVQSRSLGKLSLRIDSKARIPVLSVPKFCSRRRAVNFVNENMDWIEQSLQKLPEIRKFTDGETISLFGKEVIICHTPQSRRGVWIENDKLYVSGNAEFLHRRVRDYIRRNAAEEFYKRTKRLADILQCELNGITIKDTKSRWGSCSSLQHINYSWRIALAPDYVIDYLMAHEAAHLQYQNHSDDFWQCVTALYPEWRKGNRWLKQHGKELYSYE